MAPFDLRFFENEKGNECDFRNFNNRDCNNRSKDRCCEKPKDCTSKCCNLDQRRLREECLIAFKVYDSCRQQDCLGECELGPARAAENICINGNHIKEGEVIDTPNDAASVVIDKLKIKKIIIMNKKLNDFKKGYWDIDIKYVFEYKLTFRESNGCVIGCVKANSIYDKSVSLFGSVGSEFVIGTDLLSVGKCGDSTTVDADPFTLVEAKSLALEARLTSNCSKKCSSDINEVIVTIGLFSIIKLFRIVNLSVESRGFCIPKECEDISSDPCEFFDDLSFPMDTFAPPQKPEFLAGISGNIPRDSDKKCKC